MGAALIIDTLLYDVSTPLPSFSLLPLFVGSIVANILSGGGWAEIGWRGMPAVMTTTSEPAVSAYPPCRTVVFES